MSVFTFNLGTWTSGHSLAAWEENETHTDYLHRLGYSTVNASYGTEYGGHLEIYEAHDANSFYALVAPTGNSVFEVFIPDFPSYMLFMKDYGSAFATGGSNSTLNDIMDALGKFFRAEHGHDASDICSRCDPAGWERRLEARRRQAG